MRDDLAPGIRAASATRVLFLTSLCLGGVIVLSASAVADDDPIPDESAARKAAREENLKAMLKRAQGTSIKPAKDNARAEVVLITKPLFHYSDQPRLIVDATLWGWTKSGRLVAVCKIEKYDHPPERTWLYCFGSLSTNLMEVNWLDGQPWTAVKPGVEFRAIQKGIRPANDPIGRLRQMKELSNRFEARILVDDRNNNTQQMRLLPRPIYRYEKPEGKILDGAVFGLTTNGTNPDAILMIELHEAADGSPQWMFAMAGMTAGGLSVKLDEKKFGRNHSSGTQAVTTRGYGFGKPEIEN